MKHLNKFESLEDFQNNISELETPQVIIYPDAVGYNGSNEFHVHVPGEKIFTIFESDLDTTEYIDLGLPSGLKWASCNLGADKPCDYGLLYQFGRVDGYAYNDANHHFTVGGSTPVTTSGKTYAKGDVLVPEDDAAYVATNGKLRMPTADDIAELLAGTTKQWCQCTVLGEDHTSHAVYGRLFTSNTNGNKIFIPAAGYFGGRNGSFGRAGSNGYVWSSSVYSDSADNAYDLGFDLGYCDRDCYYRSYGYSVRGVC